MHTYTRLPFMSFCDLTEVLSSSVNHNGSWTISVIKAHQQDNLQTSIRSWGDFLLCACSPTISEAPNLSKSRYASLKWTKPLSNHTLHARPFQPNPED